MIYVESITSNIKGGVACRLGPKTIVIGPNGSGKSAVLNSIELALTGRVSDLVGRAEVAKETDLTMLAPGRSGELYAKATFTTGASASWRAGAKGAKKAQHLYPPDVLDKDAALPLRPVRDAVLGSAETARKFFLAHAAGKVTDTDVLERMPPALHDHYRRAILSAGMADTPLDKLLLALEKAKKGARDAKAKAKAATEASNDAAQGLAALPTEETIKALKAEQVAAKKKLEALIAAQSASGALDATRAQLGALKGALTEAEARLAQATEALAVATQSVATMSKPAALDDAFKQIMSAIDWHIAHAADATNCLVCGNPAVLAQYEVRKERARAFAASVTNEVQVYQQNLAVKDAAKIEAMSAEERVTSLRTQVSALDAAVAQAAAGGAPDPAIVTEARAAVERLDGEVSKIDVIKATWSAAEKARDSAKEAKEEAEKWGNLAEACITAVASLLDAGVTGFAAKVQARLPKTDQFALTLREGERQVFQFGLVRSGVLHTALSGAEWARVLAAMAAVCSPAPEKLAVVIPPPGEFDAQTLTDVLEAFGQIDQQVVLSTPVEPARIPEGWTVIRTDKEEHRAAALDSAPVAPPQSATGPGAQPAPAAPPTSTAAPTAAPPPVPVAVADVEDDDDVPPQPAQPTAPTGGVFTF